MTHEQIGVILAAAASRDRRSVGTADVLAWHQDIGDLDFDDALAAVSLHFRATTDWLMPAHIRRITAELYRDRRRAERERAEAEHAQQAAIEHGPTRDRTVDVAQLLAELRDRLPAGNPAKLRGYAYIAQESRRNRRATTPATCDPASDREPRRRKDHE